MSGTIRGYVAHDRQLGAVVRITAVDERTGEVTDIDLTAKVAALLADEIGRAALQATLLQYPDAEP